jgi:nitrite reductase/ring-hydroxylating ferredoxin subunit
MGRIVVSRLADFPPGARTIVSAGNREIGVFRVGDGLYAVRNRCPHQGGPLCLGHVFRRAVADQPGRVRYLDEAPLIACPWHGWEYDMATGQSFAGPGERRVRAYEVTVERIPGPYVAETFPVSVEDEYVVLDPDPHPRR